MNEQQKLTLKMATLFLIIFVFFGVIIVKEKFEIIFIPKVEKIFEEYLQENYTSIYSSIKKNKITYKNDTFTLKLTSKENKNHYFYLTYSKKKVKDTYKEDYLEGSSIINHIQKNIGKNILQKTNEEVTISIDKKLNDFTKQVQEKILQANSYLNLKIYNIEKEIIVKKWTNTEITSNIINFTDSMKENNITPKSYTFIITDEEDLTKSISINNLKDTLLNSDTLKQIIEDCLNNNNSELLKSNKITFKYLN